MLLKNIILILKKKCQLNTNVSNKKIFTTPKVRKFARELGANLENIVGSERKEELPEDVKKFVNSQLNNEIKKIQKKRILDHSDFGGRIQRNIKSKKISYYI